MGYYRGFKSLGTEYRTGKAKVEGTISKVRWHKNNESAIVELDDVIVTYPDGTELAEGPIACAYVSGVPFEEGIRCECWGEIAPRGNEHQLKVSSSVPAIDVDDTSDISDTLGIETDDDLANYLVEEIDGIGWAIARNTVSAFDSFDDAFDTIMHHPIKLHDMKIEGLGPTLIDRIVNHMAGRVSDDERRQIDAYRRLAVHNVSDKLRDKLIREYGDAVSAYEAIAANPYVLVNIKNVHFETADSVAATFGIVGDNPRRWKAAIDYAINNRYCNRYGHTIAQQSVIIDEVRKLLSSKDGTYLDGQYICQWIQFFIDKGMLVAYSNDTDDADRWLQSKKYFNQERNIVESVHSMTGARNQSLVSFEMLDNLIDEQQVQFESDKEYRLNKSQLDAVRLPFTNRLSLFTGGAGTGKTSTIAMIVKIADKLHIPYALCAPTGKAAKRMREVVNENSRNSKAFTVHKLLGINSYKGYASEFNDAELIICDEASMLSTSVASKLFTACSESGKHLLLTGDVNQLASVEPGAVFSDLLDYQNIAKIRLGESHRQAKGSSILDAAEGVLHGLSPIRTGLNIEFYACDDNNVNETIAKYVLPTIEGLQPYGSGDVVAFLSPRKDKVSGSVKFLNDYLRPKYNRNFINANAGDFQLDDFVIQTSNVYADRRSDNGQFSYDHMNGDQAIITNVEYDEDNGKTYTVHFDDNTEETYSEAETREYLKLAYATTVHKYQGSQCHTAVIIMLSNCGQFLLKRDLLYTALTRATDRVILVGNQDAFEDAARTSSDNRVTGIQYWLHLR